VVFNIDSAGSDLDIHESDPVRFLKCVGCFDGDMIDIDDDILLLAVYLCVCVSVSIDLCVCERERERERESDAQIERTVQQVHFDVPQ